MSTASAIDLAKTGYGRYADAERRFLRNPLPWEDLTPGEQGSWEVAAAVIAAAVEAAAEPVAVVASRDSVTPELAAAMTESRKRGDVLAEVLGWFSRNGSGHAARVGKVAIARAYRDAGLPVPEDLRRIS